MTPLLLKRLEAFKNGTENCTIFSPEERLEWYPKSIHKFIAEWNWACRYNYDQPVTPEPEGWAQYLLAMGIQLEFRNGPVEQRELIETALSEKRLILCEIRLPVPSMPDFEGRHFVLVVKLVGNTLLIHDPLFTGSRNDTDEVKYRQHVFGSNVEIDRDYFFSDDSGPMKPKTNPFQSDWGYKFIIVSKSK